MFHLPEEIIHYILTFDKRFVLRKGKLLIINTISQNDIRYFILEKKPLIIHFPTDNNLPIIRSIVCLGLKNNAKYTIQMIHFLQDNNDNRNILHCFNKYKSNDNNHNINIGFILEWINTYLQ
jgi:hypothetical protein